MSLDGTARTVSPCAWSRPKAVRTAKLRRGLKVQPVRLQLQLQLLAAGPCKTRNASNVGPNSSSRRCDPEDPCAHRRRFFPRSSASDNVARPNRHEAPRPRRLAFGMQTSAGDPVGQSVAAARGPRVGDHATYRLDGGWPCWMASDRRGCEAGQGLVCRHGKYGKSHFHRAGVVDSKGWSIEK
jgi:hypothetical protein